MRFVAELGINSEGAPKCACPKTMVEMEILNALNSTVEIELTVKDRRSGKDTMRPVWFVVESETMYLLPMYGAKTKWYQNLLANPDVTFSVRGRKITSRGEPVIEAEQVARIVERFRTKDGTDEIAKYYVKLDTAVSVPL